MGGSKWVTLWKVQDDGTRVKVGRITRKQQKALVAAQERANQLSAMWNMRRDSARNTPSSPFTEDAYTRDRKKSFMDR